MENHCAKQMKRIIYTAQLTFQLKKWFSKSATTLKHQARLERQNQLERINLDNSFQFSSNQILKPLVATLVLQIQCSD